MLTSQAADILKHSSPRIAVSTRWSNLAKFCKSMLLSNDLFWTYTYSVQCDFFLISSPIITSPLARPGPVKILIIQVNQAMTACQYRRKFNTEGEESEEQPSLKLFLYSYFLKREYVAKMWKRLNYVLYGQ